MNNENGMNPYLKFTLMIVTSTVVMFIMMYFNTYKLDHFILAKPELIWRYIWAR